MLALLQMLFPQVHHGYSSIVSELVSVSGVSLVGLCLMALKPTGMPCMRVIVMKVSGSLLICLGGGKSWSS